MKVEMGFFKCMESMARDMRHPYMIYWKAPGATFQVSRTGDKTGMVVGAMKCNGG